MTAGLQVVILTLSPVVLLCLWKPKDIGLSVTTIHCTDMSCILNIYGTHYKQNHFSCTKNSVSCLYEPAMHFVAWFRSD